jgi:hypothetical protein
VSHCPIPPLGQGQIDVSQVGDDTCAIFDATGGAGHRRGICVFLHPSQNSNYPLPLATNPPIWDPFGAFQALKNALVADGWVVAYPAYPFDWSTNGISYFGNLWEDVNNDAAFGARIVNTLGLWGDHMAIYLGSKFGVGRPMWYIGFSLGAYTALTLTANGSPTGMNWNQVGYAAHCPATDWSDLFSSQTPGYDFSTLDTTGMALTVNSLNNVTLPGIVGYSNNDATVGWTNNTSQTTPQQWEGSTVAAVTSTGAGNDFVTSPNFLPSSSAGGVAVGMFAAVTSGAAILAPNSTVFEINGNFMGVSPNTIAGGTATVEFSGPLSNTYAMVTNATAFPYHRPITTHVAATSSIGSNPEAYPLGHLMLPTDSAAYVTWVESNLDPLYPVSF